MKTAASLNPRASDLDLLGRLKGLSWLSSRQLKSLGDSMTCRDVKHKGVIFEERGALSPESYILLTGTAQLIHLYGLRPRLVAILSPGLMFRMPLMPAVFDHHFRWTALNDCRVGELSTELFINVSFGILPADYARVKEGLDGRLGYLMARYPSFLGLAMAERVAIALLELALEFGVADTRGTLLRINLTQNQIADLVGASRAKVGKLLADFERQKIIVREGRQLAVVRRNLEAIVREAAN